MDRYSPELQQRIRDLAKYPMNKHETNACAWFEAIQTKATSPQRRVERVENYFLIWLAQPVPDGFHIRTNSHTSRGADHLMKHKK
ncbi:hypothetical protein LV164_008368 [Aspergillus fumigatus]|nr:hypothetical protein KXX57_007011 [Aspergillus fumigatus]KAH1978566.1 hypothetical protein KXW88_007736 [Aspergillus fumigatus]KAH2305104.1 hypothetical protein KXV47_008703 [Aspergillus fumigatus]KAH2664759.1 hypothetical protein KXV32_007691 [Aspergillus fumigatus]KAH2768575.1 hypothetical protein KXV94_000273 [Aspergillus fumigatus]